MTLVLTHFFGWCLGCPKFDKQLKVFAKSCLKCALEVTVTVRKWSFAHNSLFFVWGTLPWERRAITGDLQPLIDYPFLINSVMPNMTFSGRVPDLHKTCGANWQLHQRWGLLM
jgi:hypothetical protein